MKQIIEIDKSLLKGKQPSLMPPNGSWISGGAIRQWFVGNERDSDIDFFSNSEESFQILTKYLVEKCGEPISSKEHADSYLFKGQLVQAIKLNFKDIQTMFDNFDFNVCQFAWDGNKVYSTLFAITSVLRGHLGSVNISKDFSIDSLRRAFKYAKKGYEPCAGTFREIASAFRDLTEEQINSQIVISPGGGIRANRID